MSVGRALGQPDRRFAKAWSALTCSLAARKLASGNHRGKEIAWSLRDAQHLLRELDLESPFHAHHEFDPREAVEPQITLERRVERYPRRWQTGAQFPIEALENRKQRFTDIGFGMDGPAGQGL